MSTLDDEIAAQPEALARLLDAETARVPALGRRLGADAHGILIAARGSSDNAARYAQYLFGVTVGLPVTLATPSVLTLYGARPRFDGLLVIGVSQSGQSPDIVAVVAEARTQGRPTIAVTNDPGSPLAAEADEVVPLHVGEERSVAATGTYVTSLAALALLAVGMRGDSGGVETISRTPQALAEALDAARAGVGEVAEDLAGRGHCMVVGRGFHYGTAFEIALKIKELSGVVAEPWSSADLRHGPIAAVDPGFPVILVAASGKAYEDVAGLIDPLRERGASLVAISDRPEARRAAGMGLALPTGQPEWAAPIAAVGPGQVLAVALTRVRGGDPDDPPGLRKVTRTT